LARWQPLLEVEAALAGSIGFPFRAYADELDRCAALGARVVCPSSSGACHIAPYAFMNRLAYPLTEARFLEDARARLPETRFVSHTTGATYRVRAADVAIDPRGASNLVSLTTPSPPDPRSFRPLEIPPIVDPNVDGASEPELRSRIDGWV